jgi:hypothetical protein
MKAGFYFSTAFTVQRMLLFELAYLALAPFLLSPSITGIVYVVVGTVMSVAGGVVLRRNRYPHLHLLGSHREPEAPVAGPPARWAAIHGFIAGFGLGAFSIFVNTVAAPAMASPWLGFLPGLVFGLGTTIALVLIGGLLGASLRLARAFTALEIKRIGALTGGRTLFFGGLLFAAGGLVALLGLDRYPPFETGDLLITLFLVGVAIPALVHSLKEVLAARRSPNEGPSKGDTGIPDT